MLEFFCLRSFIYRAGNTAVGGKKGFDLGIKSETEVLRVLISAEYHDHLPLISNVLI